MIISLGASVWICICWTRFFFLVFCFLSGFLVTMASSWIEGFHQDWGLNLCWPGWPLVQQGFFFFFFFCPSLSLEIWLCVWSLIWLGIFWGLGCWSGFYWDRRHLPSFQWVGLLCKDNDAGLASRVQDAGMTSNGVQRFCQRCGPEYGNYDGRYNWSYIGQARAGWGTVFSGILDAGLASDSVGGFCHWCGLV